MGMCLKIVDEAVQGSHRLVRDHQWCISSLKWKTYLYRMPREATRLKVSSMQPPSPCLKSSVLHHFIEVEDLPEASRGRALKDVVDGAVQDSRRLVRGTKTGGPFL
jgi:hypothetical protein